MPGHRSLSGGYAWSQVLFRGVCPRGWVGMFRVYERRVGIPEEGASILEGNGYTRGQVYQGVGGYVYPPDMGPGIPTLVLTHSCGHHNMYGWQTDGTHPTGMQSCYKCCYSNLHC